jgi:SAM-dependent methyltransferase
MDYHAINSVVEWLFWIIWVTGVLLVVAWGLSVLFGAPYLPTLRPQRAKALDLLDLKPGQVFVDLGSGDGVMLVLAAQRGLKAVGYEINPFLWFYSWLRTRRYGRRVRVKLRSYWNADLSYADGIFVFLITHRMKHLDKILAASAKAKKPKLKVVSNAFQIPGKKPLKKSGAMFLYEY